jgi:predicted RNA-binding Zn ribbon-like protein
MRFFFLGERLAVDLLNTLVVPDGRVRDLLRGPGDVAAWAEAAGVLPRGAVRGGPSGHEPAALRGFREALRRGLAAWVVGGTPRPGLIALLNRHLARDPEVSEVTASRGKVVTRRRPAGAPLERLYGAVARSAAELLASDDPRRLRRCANPSCRLMFYDVSKAGRRRWCSMRTCGGRAKVRAFYRRRHGARGVTGSR